MIEVDHLHFQLNARGYICRREDLGAIVQVLRAKTGTIRGGFLVGPSGNGKTQLLRLLAEILNLTLIRKAMVPETTEEDLFFDVVPSQQAKSGVELVRNILPEIVAACRTSTEPVLAVLDNWDVTKANCDVLLLDFLQSGRLKDIDGDIQLTAEQRDRLFVFVVMNGKRHLSEFLLRRLPVISLPKLCAEVVQAALERCHPGHVLVPHLTRLYETAEDEAALSSGITLTEMNALIDAFNLLVEQGIEPQFEFLVGQFLIKEAVDCATFSAIPFDYASVQNEIRSLPGLSIEDGESKSCFPGGLADLLGFRREVHSFPVIPEDEQIYGVLKHSPFAYSLVARVAGVPGLRGRNDR